MSDDAACSNAAGASCPGNRRMRYFYKWFLEYIKVDGASCPGNRRMRYFYKWYFRMC
jgi:hypothetical protein